MFETIDFDAHFADYTSRWMEQHRGEYRNFDAMEADLPYELKCPALLICGEKDRAGSCIRYNKAWHKETGIPIEWIKGAGHNSNTDAPETVNRLIEAFAEKL